ncbi:hypothetical protein CRH03_00595 [Clostridium sp. HMb25]|nr:hypothetical protein CRH03_00595 [Clostridium sp. HMb25]
MGRFSYAEQNGGQNASGHIVIISIGSILGAGLFCGLTVIYDMIGIHMVPLIILTGILAGIVSLFLMEMNLAGPQTGITHRSCWIFMGRLQGILLFLPI